MLTYKLLWQALSMHRHANALTVEPHLLHENKVLTALMVTTNRSCTHESNSNNKSSISSYIRQTRVSMSLPFNEIRDWLTSRYSPWCKIHTNKCEDCLKTNSVLEISTIRLKDRFSSYPEFNKSDLQWGWMVIPPTAECLATHPRRGCYSHALHAR
jgi:hypothetical protein